MLASELEFERDGAEIISGAVSLEMLDAIAPAFEARASNRPGLRSLVVPDAVKHFVAPDGPLGAIAQAYGAKPDSCLRPVRILLFDKTEETNWAVPWHQDRTISVSECLELPGFANWNVKEGVVHVEPPLPLLAEMVTLRLHFDETGDDNGALDIVPGSHVYGRLPAADVVQLGRAGSMVRCAAAKGDVLAMRLLTVHKSERAARTTRRRVLHVDYSADELPAPLRWHVQQS